MASTFPNEIDKIDSFLNINKEDIPLIRKFEEYLKNNDITNARLILNQIPNSDKKIITAEKLNHLSSCIINLEEFYQSNIYPYLKEKQLEWQLEIDKFSYKGFYDASTKYSINNMVLFSKNGDLNLFIRIAGDNIINKSPLDSEYWRELTVKGERGISNKEETTFCFDWNSSQTYSVNSIVALNSQWWIATNENKNSKPIEGNPNWNLLMSSMQSIYPLAKDMPTYQQEGEIWFKII